MIGHGGRGFSPRPGKLQRSVDSDSESSSDEQPLVRSASVPSDIVSALEHDLCGSRSPLQRRHAIRRHQGVSVTWPKLWTNLTCIRSQPSKWKQQGSIVAETSGQEVAEVHSNHCIRILGGSRSHSGVRSHTIGFIG